MALKYSKLSAREHGELLKLFIAGTTDLTAAELVRVHRNTEALFFSKLRELIAEYQGHEFRQVFDGEVEINESYFGGPERARAAALPRAR